MGQNPKEAFEMFREHLGQLLNETITDTRLALIHVDDQNIAQISFCERSTPIAAPVFAPDLYLYVGQDLMVEQQADKRWKLRIMQYRYRIQGTSNIRDADCFRWEYISPEVRDSGHCRNHLRLQGEYELGPRRIVPLHQVHLPTGWVTVEEIIRFLITELEVQPKNHHWKELLLDSEEKFREWTARET